MNKKKKILYANINCMYKLMNDVIHLIKHFFSLETQMFNDIIQCTVYAEGPMSFIEKLDLHFGKLINVFATIPYHCIYAKQAPTFSGANVSTVDICTMLHYKFIVLRNQAYTLIMKYVIMNIIQCTELHLVCWGKYRPIHY